MEKQGSNLLQRMLEPIREFFMARQARLSFQTIYPLCFPITSSMRTTVPRPALGSYPRNSPGTRYGGIDLHDPELPKLFDKNKRESRLLETFKNAYTHSRYDPTFQVSYKDIRSIWPKVKRLRKITRKTCLKKIDALDELSTGRIKEQPQPEKTSLCGRLHIYLIDIPQNWIASINNPERRRI